MKGYLLIGAVDLDLYGGGYKREGYGGSSAGNRAHMAAPWPAACRNSRIGDFGHLRRYDRVHSNQKLETSLPAKKMEARAR
jgi:hypothetical protein